MTEEKIKELARSAAHSAVIARFSQSNALEEKHAVDTFFRAFSYAIQKLEQRNEQLPPYPNNAKYI